MAIAAAGVCHSDLHMVRGEWEHRTPVVLGHEGSGVITALGDGVEGLEVGDHVVLSWVPSCGECRYCLAGRPAQCQPSAEVIAAGGTLFDGTHAAVGRRRDVLPLPRASRRTPSARWCRRPGRSGARTDAPLDVIAIVGCAVATGVGAVRNTAQVPAGATVAVIGCGGVGLSCVQGARLAGASRIVAVDLVPCQARAGRAGSARPTSSTRRAATSSSGSAPLVPEGLDFVFDAIGAIGHHRAGDRVRSAWVAPRSSSVCRRPGRTRGFDPLALAEADQRILGSNYGSSRAAPGHPELVDLLHGRRARPRRDDLGATSAVRGGGGARRPGARLAAASAAAARTPSCSAAEPLARSSLASADLQAVEQRGGRGGDVVDRLVERLPRCGTPVRESRTPCARTAGRLRGRRRR